MPSQKQKTGNLAEALVDSYLQNLGWVIIARNFRTRFGELDRIALDDTSLVFVEVKSRKGADAFMDYPSISLRQQSRIFAVASFYLSQQGPAWEHALGIEEYRFDGIYVSERTILNHQRDLLLP